MPEKTPEDSAWHKRVESKLSTDILAAEKILVENGFTREDALNSVKRESDSSVWRQFHPDAPKEFQDPTNQCFYALRILLLDKRIRDSDPRGLHFGWLWGQAAMGLTFPDIAESMRSWLLDQQRGIGGAKANDLTLTIQQIFRDKPDADSNYVLDYLQSEEAKDRFFNIDEPTVHVINVEFDEQSDQLTYEDRARNTKMIKTSSLDRKLRKLRPK